MLDTDPRDKKGNNNNKVAVLTEKAAWSKYKQKKEIMGKWLTSP